ncbi:MAG: FlgD immunoglobulin-like domain containing protein, partial [bacterium]
PGLHYDADPDSGYSVDNLAPEAPETFTVNYSGGGNLLSWSASDDEDFAFFRIYRGTTPDFPADPDHVVQVTTDTEWLDAAKSGWDVYYQLGAVDFAGNECLATAPGTLSDTPESDLPGQFCLHQNAPNPFNPSTSIAFDVPAGGGMVRLQIFDLRGRLVRRLIDGEQPAGRHQVLWKGKDDAGQQVATGIYFCQFDTPGRRQIVKMTLVQ